jgi:hypothetical protein
VLSEKKRAMISDAGKALRICLTGLVLIGAIWATYSVSLGFTFKKTVTEYAQNSDTIMKTKKAPPVVRFCDLVNDPSRYNGIFVQTTAVLVGTDLYFPSCDTGKHVWLDNEQPRIYSELRRYQEFWRAIHSASEKDQSVEVSIYGRFVADGRRFGALDQYLMQFEAYRLVSARTVSLPPPEQFAESAPTDDDLIRNSVWALSSYIGTGSDRALAHKELVHDEFHYFDLQHSFNSKQQFAEFTFEPFPGKVATLDVVVRILGDHAIASSVVLRILAGSSNRGYRCVFAFTKVGMRWLATAMTVVELPLNELAKASANWGS